MKAGFKTTEFAFLVVFTLLQTAQVALGQVTDPTISTIAVAVVGAAYAIARGLAKQQGIDVK